MKLLILGAWDSCNLGDSVICQCVRKRLEQEFPEAEIRVEDMILRNRQLPQSNPPVKYLEKRRIFSGILRIVTACGIDRVYASRKALLRQEEERLLKICGGDYDGVVFAGGQMFMDGYGLLVAYCTQQFARRQIPVFFNACGVGSFSSSRIRKTLAEALALPNVKFISCRDGEAEVQAMLPPGTQVARVWDPAIAAGKRMGISSRPAGERLGLGVMYPAKESPWKALKFWKGVIAELEDRGLDWQLFTNGDPADMTFAQMVLDAMPRLKGKKDLLAPRDTQPEGLVSTVAGYRGLIGTRLHSHIIAASLGILSVAVVWDEKIPMFFGKLGIKDRCVTLSTKPAQVVDALLEAMGQPDLSLPREATDPEAPLINAMKTHLRNP